MGSIPLNISISEEWFILKNSKCSLSDLGMFAEQIQCNEMDGCLFTMISQNVSQELSGIRNALTFSLFQLVEDGYETIYVVNISYIFTLLEVNHAKLIYYLQYHLYVLLTRETTQYQFTA